MNHRGEYPEDWRWIARAVKDAAGWHCIRCKKAHCRDTWTILTVHHFDGDKSNCKWWNLLALCQRCHLSIQGRVDPYVPYMFEHSQWLKPYVAAFYSWKYLKTNVTRDEAIARLEELLSLERAA